MQKMPFLRQWPVAIEPIKKNQKLHNKSETKYIFGPVTFAAFCFLWQYPAWLLLVDSIGSMHTTPVQRTYTKVRYVQCSKLIL